MKGKTKTQKGITLVALIITIIVLLILAVVAITAIQNDGIFSHADNAATMFNDAQGNEQNHINDYETFLNTYGGGSTVVTPPDDGDGDDDDQTSTGTPITFTVEGLSGGLQTTYNATEGQTWASWLTTSNNPGGLVEQDRLFELTNFGVSSIPEIYISIDMHGYLLYEGELVVATDAIQNNGTYQVDPDVLPPNYPVAPDFENTGSGIEGTSITFTVDGETFTAKQNQTWGNWVTNDAPKKSDGGSLFMIETTGATEGMRIVYLGGQYPMAVSNVTNEQTINNGQTYSLENV